MNKPTPLPIGGSVPFTFTLQTVGIADDVSAATEIDIALCQGDEASRSLVGDRITASDSATGADWSVGVVAGAFTGAMTSGISNTGIVDIQIKVTIGGENLYYFVSDAVELVGVV